MPRRVDDWFKQAEKDLKHARHSLEKKDYEWACFASQQAAEKALKSLYQSLGGEFFGHSISKMLHELPKGIKPSESLLKKGTNLDKLYIPTRYPNGFESGSPEDYYDKEDAEKAIADAEEIIEFARGKISR